MREREANPCRLAWAFGRLYHAARRGTYGNLAVSDRDYWERHAGHYDASVRVFAKPLARMIELTRVAVKGRGRVLEVAAGTGLVTTVISEVVSELVATDYAASMVAILEKKVRERGLRNVSCRQADIYALDFAAQSFDAVVAANVLHLVPDLDAALAALRRVLAPGGKLVAPTFCHGETWLASLVSHAGALAGFPVRRRFTTASLVAALESAGGRTSRVATLPGLIPIGYVEATFE